MYKRKGIKYSIRRYINMDNNFTQIPNDAFRIIANGNCFIVYCYLCRNYNKDYDYAFPSIKCISKNTGLSIPTVQKCLKELEEDAKLIKKIKFQNKESGYLNNCYKIYFPVIQEEKDVYDIPQLTEEQIKELEEFENSIYEIETEEFEIEEEEKDS